MVLAACGRAGARVQFDTSKPEGHPGRFPAVEKAKQKLGWESTTPLDDGLRRTIEWYLAQRGGG
jgi:nucleoside-diphosphate-sugar epimerase